MKVVVGSENPVKIEAVRRAFNLVWPKKKWNVVGLKVSSEISDQPMSDVESIKGAKNRARKCIKVKGAAFGIGIEGGLQKIGRIWFDCGWIVVLDKKGRMGIGSSSRMETPGKIMKLVYQGRELGDANDIIFGTKYSKQKEGHFGLMTKGLVKRADGYEMGVIMALSRFIRPEMF